MVNTSTDIGLFSSIRLAVIPKSSAKWEVAIADSHGTFEIMGWSTESTWRSGQLNDKKCKAGDKLPPGQNVRLIFGWTCWTTLLTSVLGPCDLCRAACVLKCPEARTLWCLSFPTSKAL
mmetsp:Transcript_23449/g.51015  ORF Transcript_23449/g.51015 Transcript_23449/m.51015 type:complete len:119 (+) Transcript_23449:62-418(+)